MATTAQLASHLWSLCDILRDDGITYHQYINELSYLLFLKMSQETGVDADLPDWCRWSSLASSTGKKQFDLYRRLLVHLGTEGQGVIREIFANPTSLLRKPQSLQLLVKGIDDLDWHDTTKEGFGDVYEELLKYSSEKRSGAGQYFTPRELVETLVAVLQPTREEAVQDPALGTGGFLVAAHQFASRKSGSRASKRRRKPRLPPRYIGVELVPENYRIALMNAFVHNMDVDFRLGDTLSSAGQSLPHADVILTNPPFGSRRGGSIPTRSDLPFPTTNKQFAFIQHVVLGLKAGGRSAVVIPDNVLFEDGIGQQVRRHLMTECNLHTILRLPAGIFYAAAVKTNVLLFTKGSPTQVVWVYDARSGIRVLTRRDRPLTRAHFHEFEHCFGADPYGRGTRSVSDSPSGRWRSFAIEEIVAAEYRLDRFHQETEDGEIADQAEPEDVLQRLQERLRTVTDEVASLAEIFESEKERV